VATEGLIIQRQKKKKKKKDRDVYVVITQLSTYFFLFL
jgi:hypothetical protein